MKTLARAALVLAVVTVVVWLAKTGSLGAVAPWAIVLACPLMHLGMMVFMGHGCHHDHGGHEHRRGEDDSPGRESRPARAEEV